MACMLEQAPANLSKQDLYSESVILKNRSSVTVDHKNFKKCFLLKSRNWSRLKSMTPKKFGSETP